MLICQHLHNNLLYWQLKFNYYKRCKCHSKFYTICIALLKFVNVQFAQLHNCHAKNNFILHLNQPYKNIQNGYTKTLGYSLNKANKFSLTYTIETNFAITNQRIFYLQ
jgi:hypothetical protein